MALVWDEEPRIRLLAAMWYQQKTHKQLHLKPNDVVLTAQEYIESNTAAQWLNIVIKVFLQ